MPAAPPSADVTEHFAICGQVGAAVFPWWITRHAARLGLGLRFVAHSGTRLDMIVSGPPDLLDAMALACSLGPQEVWVDQVDRRRANDRMDAKSSSPAA